MKESLLPIGINDLKNKAYAIANQSRDYIVESPDINAEFYNGALAFHTRNESLELPLTSWAFGQLCGKVGVPIQYAERCMEAEMHALIEDNINQWLARYEGNLMIRTTGDHIRGILTPRYTPYDSDKILEDVESGLMYREMGIKSALINEERLQIRLCSPEPMDIEGEELYVGVIVDSSDVGRAQLHLHFFIYRPICTNGMILTKKFGELYSHRHVGITPGDFRREFQEGIDLVEPLVAKVENAVKASIAKPLDYALGNETDMEETIKSLRKLSLSKREAVKVISEFKKGGYDNTVWGWTNAITRTSQLHDSIDDRTRMEAVAGNLFATAI